MSDEYEAFSMRVGEPHDELHDKFRTTVRTLSPVLGGEMPSLRVEQTPPQLLASQHYRDTERVRGFVVKVPGSADLSDPTARAAVLHHETGFGTSLYAIDGVHTTGDIADRFRKAAGGSQLPSLPAYNEQSSIAVYRSTNPVAVNDQYYIGVRANDTPAAVRLMEQIAHKPKTTIAELVASSDFQDLQKSSQCVRDQLAAQTATALDVKLKQPTPIHTSVSDSIIAANVGAHGEEGEGAHFVVLNDAIAVNDAHNGVMISHGMMGGLTHVQGANARTRANGQESTAWTTDYMSVAPASTGYFDQTVHSKAALHFQHSAEAAQAFQQRVHWSGTLRSYHPRAKEVYVAQDDASVVGWMNDKLKPKDGSALSSRDLHFVAGILPDTSTLGMNTKQLGDAIGKCSAESLKSVPVLFDGETALALHKHWDDIQAQLTPEQRGKYTPGKVFQSSGAEPLDDVFTVRSSCHGGADGEHDTQHWHPWHAVAGEQHEFEKRSGETLEWRDNRWHPRSRFNQQIERRHTVLYIDTALVPLVLAALEKARKQ
jgi:hypothetical protein